MLFICVIDLGIIGFDSDYVPVWHQAIVVSSDGVLSFTCQGTELDDTLIETSNFVSKKSTPKSESPLSFHICHAECVKVWI